MPRHNSSVAQLARSVDGELAAMLSELIEQEAATSASLVQHVARLREQSIMVGQSRDRLDEKLRQLSSRGKVGVRPRTQRGAAAARAKLLADAKALYPREALELFPPLWSCPMHQELMETGAGNCPVCGMPLEPIYVTQPQLTEGPIIGAVIIADGPLRVGRRAECRIRLFFLDDGQPVRLADLEEAHTRKIHLLISDIAETDYHHEHPEPAGDGEYAFGFTPRRPDTYRVRADLSRPNACAAIFGSGHSVRHATPGKTGRERGGKPARRDRRLQVRSLL